MKEIAVRIIVRNLTATNNHMEFQLELQNFAPNVALKST